MCSGAADKVVIIQRLDWMISEPCSNLSGSTILPAQQESECPELCAGICLHEPSTETPPEIPKLVSPSTSQLTWRSCPKQ